MQVNSVRNCSVEVCSKTSCQQKMKNKLKKLKSTQIWFLMKFPNSSNSSYASRFLTSNQTNCLLNHVNFLVWKSLKLICSALNWYLIRGIQNECSRRRSSGFGLFRKGPIGCVDLDIPTLHLYLGALLSILIVIRRWGMCCAAIGTFIRYLRLRSGNKLC